MAKISEIYGLLNDWAPFSTCLGFDNAGLLVGGDGEVKNIAVVLDITPDAVNKSAALGCGLIVSHHPVIFSPLKELSADSLPYMLAQKGIAAICAHTNLDAADGGVSDALAERIGLADITKLADPAAADKPPIARLGRLERPMTPQDMAVSLRDKLTVGAVKFTPSDSFISRVAVCGGSGGDLILPAKEAGADALVTGECRHHERLIAKQKGISLFECGHFCTEKWVKANIARRIATAFNDITVYVLDECDPAQYV